MSATIERMEIVHRPIYSMGEVMDLMESEGSE